MNAGRHVLLVALSLSTAQALAASYHVNDASTAGDVGFSGCPTMGAGADLTTCGSCAAPCLSLQYAYDHLPLTGGDIVYVNAGIYSSGGTTPILVMANPVKAGAANNMLTFVGPQGPDGRAAINAGQTPMALLNGGSTAWAGVVLRVPGIRLQGLGIANLTSQGCGLTADFCGSGVRIFDTDVVSSFELVGLNIGGITGPGANGVDVDQVATTCTHCWIINNSMRAPGVGNQSSAIYVAGMGGVEIRANELVGWGQMGGARGATLIAIGTGAAGMVVENNVITDSFSDGIEVTDCLMGMKCFPLGSANVKITNNTFRLSNKVTGFATVLLSQGTGHTLRNNIFQSGRGELVRVEPGVTFTSDFNAFHLLGTATVGSTSVGTYPSLAAWQATGQDANSLGVNPLFVSASDSHLQSPAGHHNAWGILSSDVGLSPLVDRGDPTSGFLLEQGPNGDRIDLGAFGNTAQNSLTPSLMAAVSGNGQSAPIGTALTQPLVVRVSYLSTGAPALGVKVLFVSSSGGSCSPSTAITDAQGRASSIATVGMAGGNTVSVTAPDATGIGPVVFNAISIPVPDGGTGDAGTSDAGTSDAGATDAGATDAGATDAGATDSGMTDAGPDAEADAGVTRRNLRIGCGCGTVDSSELVFSLAVLGALITAQRRKWVV